MVIKTIYEEVIHGRGEGHKYGMPTACVIQDIVVFSHSSPPGTQIHADRKEDADVYHQERRNA